MFTIVLAWSMVYHVENRSTVNMIIAIQLVTII